MGKKNILWIFLDLVFLVVFNMVFFIAGGIYHPASVWISYGFIHFAYMMLLATSFFIRKSSNAVIFRFSLYAISSMYFFVAFIVGIVFVIMHPESYKASLIIQVVIAGGDAIILLSNMLANENTAESIERHEVELQYVKRSSAMLKGIMDMTDNKTLKKNIEKAYDLLHSSQVKSDNSVYDYEVMVMDLIETLENNVSKNDDEAANAVLEKIIKNANERNRRLRY
jgi:hypothetical protein